MSDTSHYPLDNPLVVVGPTASGKSAVAMEIARRSIERGGAVELLSADSMQVYRGMDIGTAKPSEADQRQVPHHLIDVVDPDQEFSVAEFLRLADQRLGEIRNRQCGAIVVGGTGLYIQALVDRMEIPGQFPGVRAELESESNTAMLYEKLTAMDPVSATRMEPTNHRRIIRALEVTIGSGRPFSSYGPGLTNFPATRFVPVGLEVDRDDLTTRIRQRLQHQIDGGFLDEVERVSSTFTLSKTASQALGYKELSEHLAGRCSLEEAVELTVLRSRQLAVRQIKWFRRDPRIRFFDYQSDPLEIVDEVEKHWINEARTRDDGYLG